MASKNIVIAPCGNKTHLFRKFWLNQKSEKNFEVCLLFYHEHINEPELYKDVDYFYHLKGFKYHMLHELLTKIHPEWLQQYDFFYFLDDDIEINTLQINSMFLASQVFNSLISQAALSKDSFCSWPMFKQQDNCYCRFVGQIEVMAPLFNREALVKCLPSFIGNRSSWGVDSVWSKILDYPKDKLIVFDKIIMKHTLPVGGGELYKKIGVDPHDEWKMITQHYEAKKDNYQEYGRLEFVNEKNNRIKYFGRKCSEFVEKRMRLWKDYDLLSRIQNQQQKLFGKKKQVEN